MYLERALALPHGVTAHWRSKVLGLMNCMLLQFGHEISHQISDGNHLIRYCLEYVLDILKIVRLMQRFSL